MALLSIEQLAEQLGVSKSTVSYWVCKNKIPFIKLPNRAVRFDQTKIDTWLKHQSVSTNMAGIKV